MISQTINRKLLYSMMKQDLPPFIAWDDKIDHDSYRFKCYTNLHPVNVPADEFLQVFDGETLAEVQRNISLALTVSKHLLMYDKQDLIWFQKTLARMKNARGAFRDQHRCNEGAVLG